MGIKSLFSVNYLNWSEYMRRIKMISWFNMVDSVAQRSINNWWKNYEKDTSI